MNQNIKQKDSQIQSLTTEIKELRKINSMEKLDEAFVLQEKLTEVTRHLESRDNEYKDMLKRQDILEKSFQQRMRNEFKKQKSLQQELKADKDKIAKLESVIKEKDKLIQRYHIYSGKKVRLASSKSEENISNIQETSAQETFFKELESKLSILKNNTNKEEDKSKKAEPEVIAKHDQDKVETTPLATQVNHVEEAETNVHGVDEKDDTDSESDVDEEDDEEASQASTAIQTGDVCDNDISPSKKDVSLSPRDKYSNQNKMFTMDRVNLWLPLASTKGREIQVSIDEDQKAKLLAKLNEIDNDSINADSNYSIIPVASNNNNNNNNIDKDKKQNLMEVLFGSKAENSSTKPLKTSLKTSPSSSSKSVKFIDSEHQ